MRLLYFDKDITGHHLEYIHHLYMGMLKQKNNEYIFVIPESFIKERDKYDWPDADNILFDFLTEKDIKTKGNEGILKNAWNNSMIVRMKVKKHKPDTVLLISLMEFIPFLLFMLPSKVKISGIIYQIYLYKWKKMRLFAKIKSAVIYWLIAKAQSVDKIFILNDPSATLYLNKIYKTNHFTFLPDPLNDIDYKPKNIRKELGIKEKSRMFLHFGGLTKRKGTLTILEAIQEIPLSYRETMAIVFAGKVYPDIYDSFYRLIEDLASTIYIKVFDYFCSNEQIADLCHTTDFIMIPYESEAQSSGIISHAAYHNKPVIGPDNGLLGKIIRRNKLGIALKELTPNALAKSMLESIPYQTETKYKHKNTKELFIETILDK